MKRTTSHHNLLQMTALIIICFWKFVKPEDISKYVSSDEQQQFETKLNCVLEREVGHLVSKNLIDCPS